MELDWAVISLMLSAFTCWMKVNADNIKDITAQSNSIQGDFKKLVTYGSASGTLFQTERPVFATDNLETLLEQHNVPISATPPGTGGAPPPPPPPTPPPPPPPP